MKNDRIGEHLWDEWDGDLYEPISSERSAVYYTIGHVDLDNPIVKRALASAIQRDGIALSLSDAFSMVERSTTSYGWVGLDEFCYTYCSEEGETYYGDVLQSVEPSTFVEI